MNNGIVFNQRDCWLAFSAGEFIFHKGEPGHVMYGIVEGEVEILFNDRAIDVSGTGEIVGEMALVDVLPRCADAVAKTACILEPIDQERFLSMIKENPFFAIQVMQIMSGRLRRRLNDLTPDCS